MKVAARALALATVAGLAAAPTRAQQPESGVDVLEVNTEIMRAGSAGERLLGDTRSLLPGDVVVYRLVFTNLTGGPVRDVVVEDSVPAGLRLVGRSIETTLGPSGLTFATGEPPTDPAGNEGPDEDTRPGSGEPSAPARTRIRWAVEEPVPAGQTLTLAFRAEAAGEARLPAGTALMNVATVRFTDAAGRVYSEKAGSRLTMGIDSHLDVRAVRPSVAPRVGARDTIDFRITNVGNGSDRVILLETVSDPGTLAINGYLLDGSTYPTFAGLASAVESRQIPAGARMTIGVDYTIASGSGGAVATYVLTATSERDHRVSSSNATTVNVVETLGVAVTPDGGRSLLSVLRGGSTDTLVFAVANTGDGPETVRLTAVPSTGDAVAAIEALNGEAGAASAVALDAGGRAEIAVAYRPGALAPGSVGEVTLHASAASDTTVTDSGSITLLVVRPTLRISREIYRDDGATHLSGHDATSTTEFLRYRVTVTNTGQAPAPQVRIQDPLPPGAVFLSATHDGKWSSVAERYGAVVADLQSALPGGGASASFWVRVRVN